MNLLFLDIENSYILAGVWGLWQQNVNTDLILDSGKVLCFAAKKANKDTIIYSKHDRRGFLVSVHSLLDWCDAVVTYNGKKHDIPLLNREFLKAGLTPPSPYKHIDLLITAKKAFKFPSNKMVFLTEELGLGSKLEHEGFELWVKCLQGDKTAWKTMEAYNRQDVVLLEKLYYKLLPWIDSHPNHNLYGTSFVCPNCGSNNLQRRGTHKTLTGIFQRLSCNDCGKWARTRYTEVNKEDRKDILVGAV